MVLQRNMKQTMEQIDPNHICTHELVLHILL